MRDEEIRKVRYDISIKRNHVPNQNHGTSDVIRSPLRNQNVEQSLDSDDGNNPTIELHSTEKEAVQYTNLTSSLLINQDFFTGTLA